MSEKDKENLEIFDDEGSELVKVDEITGENISDYPPVEFVEEMVQDVIQDIKDKCPTFDLPVTVRDLTRCTATELYSGGLKPLEGERDGIVILYGDKHTALYTRRTLADGKIEITVFDAYSNSKELSTNRAIGKMYSDSSKYVIMYPDTVYRNNREVEFEEQKSVLEEKKTDLERQKTELEKGPLYSEYIAEYTASLSGEDVSGEATRAWEEELGKIDKKIEANDKEIDTLKEKYFMGDDVKRRALGVQMDDYNCISIALGSLDEICKATVTNGFNKVLESLETKQGEDGRKFVMLPDYVLKYAQKEETLNLAIEATKKAVEAIEAEIEEKKRKQEEIKTELTNKLELYRDKKVRLEGHRNRLRLYKNERNKRAKEQASKESKDRDNKEVVKKIEEKFRHLNPLQNLSNKQRKRYAERHVKREATSPKSTLPSSLTRSNSMQSLKATSPDATSKTVVVVVADENSKSEIKR
ncbi:hypothetical protein FACS1894152_4360 [Bacilli bacterium]|nr:hypothetical protein FACS1894152_4360 [Bacilli bacterium]